MQKIIEVPGIGNVEFPDSMSDEAIAAVIKTQMMGKQPPSGPSPDNRTRFEMAGDKINAIPGMAARFVTGLPGAIAGVGGIVKDTLTGNSKQAQESARGMIEGMAAPILTPLKGLVSGKELYSGGPRIPEFEEGDPSSPKWDQAQEGAVQALVGAGLSKVLPRVASNVVEKIPTEAKAGLKFDAVAAKANAVPVNTAAADAIVARAQELRSRGSTLPKVLNDFIKARKEGAPDVTYEAGRDFSSNAGALSTRETTAMNAKMQRQVAQFSNAMKEANREAAVKVGMGDMYDSAMKEFRQAKTIKQTGKVLAKWGVAGIGAIEAYRLYHDLSKK